MGRKETYSNECECGWGGPHKSHQFAVATAAKHFNATGHTVKVVITFTSGYWGCDNVQMNPNPKVDKLTLSQEIDTQIKAEVCPSCGEPPGHMGWLMCVLERQDKAEGIEPS